MHSVAAATDIVTEAAFVPLPEAIPLVQATGRVLHTPLHADRDFPPFDRVTMDGIALVFEEWATGRRVFAVVGTAAAGQPRQCLQNPRACIEVMTGAVLPEGTDTVVRYEDITMQEGVAQLQEIPLKKGQNVHRQGSDRQQGAVLLRAGDRLGPAEIAVAATVGAATVAVRKRLTVAVVSTGDEIVPVSFRPLPHQIRSSNTWAIAALLQQWTGAEARIFHFPDDQQQMAAGIEEILGHCDVLILSGAVSEGKFDYVPGVLQNLGVQKQFHKVAQRPGKPFWFGRCGPQKVVFALPGNPVSAFLCTCRYVLPFLERSLGVLVPTWPEPVVLGEPVVFAPALTYFLPCALRVALDGSRVALPVSVQGSGDLASLTSADGFIELPAERSSFEAGEAFPFYRYRLFPA
jgi:molybdopterin molybdotransferase